MEDIKPQLDILWHQVKPPVRGMDDLLLNKYSEMFHKPPLQTSQDISKATGYSP